MTTSAKTDRETANGDYDLKEMNLRDLSAWKGKKVIAINSSSTYEYRVRLFCSVMESMGVEVLILGSDFDHLGKKKRTCRDEKTVFLPTRPYRRNISLDRVRSHLEFSRDALRWIKLLECDLLYIVLPPNSQAGIAKAYKKHHPHVRILMDVIDLWPESFPVRIPKIWFFPLWAHIRNKYLKDADLLMMECGLYQDHLFRYIQNPEAVSTIYWAHSSESPDQSAAIEASINASINTSQDTGEQEIRTDKWILGYLGSVNNITSISAIVEAVKKLRLTRPVVVRIVGTGEHIRKLVKRLKAAGAKVENYGECYDFDQKLRIFGSCHFGLNFMKTMAVVGMSMKSVDFFQMGVPVLHNLSGEFEEIIRDNHLGRNDVEIGIFGENLYDAEMKRNAREFYLKNCSYEAYREKVRGAIEKL